MAGEKFKTFTNGEIPHLAELSYKADLEAANRNKTGNARTNMRTVAQCTNANLLNEIKEELQLPEDLDSVLTEFLDSILASSDYNENKKKFDSS